MNPCNDHDVCAIFLKRNYPGQRSIYFRLFQVILEMETFCSGIKLQNGASLDFWWSPELYQKQNQAEYIKKNKWN